MKNKKLVIIGNSGNAKLAHHYFEKDSPYKVVAFSVNESFIAQDTYCGLPVVPYEEIENIYPNDEFDVFVAIGYSMMNKIREKMYLDCKAKGYFLPNYISSRCSFLTEENIGDNNFMLEDNTIQPFVKIGSNNVIWSGNHIGHDTTVGDNNFITSHVVISGFCIIKNNTFIGVNATLRDAILIEDETLIAAGAIVMKDTKPKEVYVPSKSVLISKTSDEIAI